MKMILNINKQRCGENRGMNIRNVIFDNKGIIYAE